MANLSREAEACLWNERSFDDLLQSVRKKYQSYIIFIIFVNQFFLIQHRLDNFAMDTTQSIALSAVQASYSVKAAAIVVLTTSGVTAKMCSKYHPK